MLKEINDILSDEGLPELFPIPDYPKYFADLEANIWSIQPRGNHQKEYGRPKKLSKFPCGSTDVLSVKIKLPDGKKVQRSAAKLFHLAFPKIIRQKRIYGPKLVCTAEGCETVSRARGLCNKHYVRRLRNGSVQSTQWGRV